MRRPRLQPAWPLVRWGVLPLLLTAMAWTGLRAQVQPTMAAFQFSNGVHPTFDATFPDADERMVSRFWQNELKAISMRVTNKKEMVGHVARIPTASPDTLQVLIAVEKPKGLQRAVAHIAFFTTSGYVGPDSPQREQDGCLEWVRQRMVILQRQVAQAAVDEGQRELDGLNRQLTMLQREEQRMESGLHRARQRMYQAVQDSTQAAARTAELQAPVDTSGMDSTTNAAREKQRAKDLARWQDRSKRSAHTRQDMQQRVQDLQWALKKSKEDQAAKQAQVSRQETVVRELQERVQAIH